MTITHPATRPRGLALAEGLINLEMVDSRLPGTYGSGMGGAANGYVRAVAATLVVTFLACFALVACGTGDDLIRNTIRLGDSAPTELAQRNLDQYQVLLDDLKLPRSDATPPRTSDPILNALGQTVCVGGDIASELPDGVVVSGLARVDPGTGEVLGLVEIRPGYMPTSVPEGFAYFMIETGSVSTVGNTISFFCQD